MIELHTIFGATLKGLTKHPKEYWIIIARIWNPALPDIGDLAANAGLV